MKHCNSEYEMIEIDLNNSVRWLGPNQIESLHPFTERSFGIRKQLR